MTAGAIAVPTVMPLRMPVAGVPKNHIDSNTLIEIQSGIIMQKFFVQLLFLKLVFAYAVLRMQFIDLHFVACFSIVDNKKLFKFEIMKKFRHRLQNSNIDLIGIYGIYAPTNLMLHTNSGK